MPALAKLRAVVLSLAASALMLGACSSAEEEVADDEQFGEVSSAVRSREIVRGYKLPFTPGASRKVVQYPHDYRDQIWNAVDIGMARGTEVLAMKAGTVSAVIDTFADYGAGYVCNWAACNNQTNFVIVQHDDGNESSYLHVARGSVSGRGIRPGTRVCQGQPIATIGHNGYSYGPHVHVSVQAGGSAGNRNAAWGAMWSKPTKVIHFQELGGELREGAFVVSSNTVSCGATTAPAPSPAPEPEPAPAPSNGPKPASLTPNNDADAGSSAVTLAWSAVAGARSYDVAIRYEQDGASLPYYTYRTSQPTQRFWPKIRNTRYRWTVTATLGDGKQARSDEATFRFR